MQGINLRDIFIIRIRKKELFFFLLIFSSFTPQIFEISAPRLENIINYCKIASLLIICWLYFRERKKLSTTSSLFAISAAWYLFSSYFSGGSLYNALITCITQLSISMIVEYFLDEPETVINVFMVIFELLIYSNLYSLVRYAPDGYMMYGGADGQRWYYLGLNNNFIKIFLPGIMVALIKKEMGGNKYRTNLLMIVCYISILYEWSATTVSGLFVLLLYYFVGPYINTHIELNFKKIFVYSAIADVLVTFFNIAEKSTVINYLFTNILDRNDTLTGRTRIWKEAKEMIKKRPILGYGSNSSVVLPNIAEYRWVNRNAGHAHNHWFQVLIEGGIPYLALYLAILKQINSQYEKATENAQKIIKAVFICFFLVCITQNYSNEAHMALILILGYHINTFIPNEENDYLSE